jgi:phosphoglycerate kinase
MAIVAMNDLDLRDQRVLIREDFNVPIRDGLITSDKRLLAALPTIELALEKGAALILMSHLGRPKEGHFDKRLSLAPVADYLEKALNRPVRLESHYLETFQAPSPGEIVLLENVRFNPGEKANEDTLSKQLAALCDVFVMDAFGSAHRAHASTVGVAKYAPKACAGPLLMQELKALKNVFKSPERPVLAIVGGSKVSGKLKLLKELLNHVDTLIVGGGITNTFLKAQGHEIGNSLYEEDLLDEAKELLSSGKTIPMPSDVVVAKQLSETAPAYTKALADIAEDDMILDMGPSTVAHFKTLIEQAKTIIWNGPIGVFEYAPFSYGTKEMAFAVAESDAYSLAGGGDTLAAIDKCGLQNNISYISTGGGAFLEYLEGKALPGVAALG